MENQSMAASNPDTPDTVCKLECNLDDMTGEELGHAAEILMGEGALDVWLTPIQMKKGRPGQMLSLLCRTGDRVRMAELIFAHTTTIGVRASIHERITMSREMITLETEYGPIPAKESRYGEICKIKPEFDAVKKLSAETGVTVAEILRRAYTKSIDDESFEI